MKTIGKMRKLLSIAILCGVCTFAQAQGGPIDPGGDPGGGPGAGGVPLDGGLSLLIAAGVGYAAKKGYDKRKKADAAMNEEV